MGTGRLRVIPLGGLGEIGKNMMALEIDDEIVVIDAGVLFPDQEMPGVDLVIPDITYLMQNQARVKGILITHGHEDHIGALAYVLPRLHVPVYAPRLAHGLIRVKLREHRAVRGAKLIEVTPGKIFKIGKFRVEWFRVCHSIPDAMGIALHTPLGLVVHTGDFKIDHTPVDGKPTDFVKLSQLAAQGVFLLFSDSTYADVPGYTSSEVVVGQTLERVIAEAPGRVMVATFASLISRMQQVITAATRVDRRVAFVGRSMIDNVSMSLSMGYLSDPQKVVKPLQEIRHLSPEKVVLMATGSQGEPTSALVRIANRDHKEIHLIPGDTVVVSSTPIPGNETVVSKTIDNLYRQGAKVLYHRNALVHVHGHASQEELKMMINMTRPRFFIPVHGEYRHLVAHVQLAQSLGIPPENTFILEDGDVLDLTEREGVFQDRVPSGNIFVDGHKIWDIGSVVLRDRKVLSKDGVVIVVLTLDKATGRMVKAPEVVSSGFVDAQELAALQEKTIGFLREALSQDTQHPLDLSYLDSKVKSSLERFIYYETRRRPLIIPVAVEV